MFYIYIITNYTNSTLYTGVTNNLIKRISEHKRKLVKGFTKKYNINKLVYFEEFWDSYSAISREKQIKAGSRKKKEDIINAMNPNWIDLFGLIEGVKDISSFTDRRDRYLESLIK
jgi:putative endonuclease